MPENLSMKMNLSECGWEGEGNSSIWDYKGGRAAASDLCVYVNPAGWGFGLIGWRSVSSFIDFMDEGKMQ